MDKATFANIRKHAPATLKITNENLSSKAMELSSTFMRYYDQYIDEYKIYQDMLAEKDKKYGELFRTFRYSNQQEAVTKQEIEAFIHSDEGYYQLRLRLNEQELVVKYLEDVCDAIKKMAYNIKSIIDLKNLGMPT